MTTECASLDEYALTAPGEIRPLVFAAEQQDADRAKLMQSLGLDLQATTPQTARRAAILAAGFRPCSPETAIRLMDPNTHRVTRFDGDMDASDGGAINRRCGFWPGIEREYFGVGKPHDLGELDFVPVLRATYRRPQRSAWYRPLPRAKPEDWYLLGAMRRLVEPMPYGVGLRLKEVTDAGIFPRIAVVARCEHFLRAAGGDPVILGGVPTGQRAEPHRMTPHDWFFVALWK